MKAATQMLVLATACGMLTGCVTDHGKSAKGGVHEVGTQSGSGQFVPAPRPPKMVPNGSIGQGNPFGMQAGNVAH